jgi:hypothetical protein
LGKQYHEDGELSEGNSDSEGDEDDLSPQKLKMLFSIIKHKKTKNNPKMNKKLSDGYIQGENEEIRNNRKSFDCRDVQKNTHSFQTDALELYFRVNPLQFEVPEPPPPLP